MSKVTDNNNSGDLEKELREDSDLLLKNRVETLVEMLYREGDEKRGSKAYSDFSRRLKLKQWRGNLHLYTRYAAAVILLIVSTAIVTTYFNTQIDTNAKEATNKLFVPIGQRVQFTLQDATTVWLNSNTTLTYPSIFSKNNREIEIKGEAFFEVTKDVDRPFIVTADGISIKVLGTSFNVSNYDTDEYITTSLLEGSVEVCRINEPSKIVKLKPNQQLQSSDYEMKVNEIPFQDHFLWRYGINAFKDENLLDVLKHLELYYNVEIHLVDPMKFDVCFTGKFRQRDGIEDVLRIIQQIYPFKIERNTERNIITLN